METKSIIGLDLIRFAAATSVMWFHLAYYSWSSPQSPSGMISEGLVNFSSMAPTAWFGWVGVHVFFVISGFVISYSAQGKDAYQFAISRFLRLYPAVWICATITLVFLLMVGDHDGLVRRYLASVSLFPLQPWVDAVYWTLGVEMVFYGLVFLLLLRNWLRYLKAMLAILGVASSVMWMAWAAGLELHALRLTRIAELLLIPYGCHFALGGLIWLGTTRRLSPLLYGAAGVSFVGGAIGVYSQAMTTQYSPFIPVLFWMAAVALVIGAAHWNDGIFAITGRWRRAIRLTGLATYPLYLLHDVAGAATMRWSVLSGMDQHAALLIAMVFVVVVSFVVASLLEPALRAATKWFGRTYLLPRLMVYFQSRRAARDAIG
jgi:peptidoglycan/LPS O-acetylase OafA/YrhL